MVKFDHALGPVILDNHSTLSERSLMNLAIKGTSTLMGGVSYGFENTRRFRGLLQLDDYSFAYGFDMLLLDDDSDTGALTPVMVFLVFPSNNITTVGSNIKSIESMLYHYTQPFMNISNITPGFGDDLVTSLQQNLVLG